MIGASKEQIQMGESRAETVRAASGDAQLSRNFDGRQTLWRLRRQIHDLARPIHGGNEGRAFLGWRLRDRVRLPVFFPRHDFLLPVFFLCD